MAFTRREFAGAAPDTTITSGIGTGDTSLTIASGTGWPTGGTGPFYAVLDPGGAAEEKILVTTRSTTTLSGITRGVDGTTAATHASGAAIRHCLTAVDLDEANQAVVAVLGAAPTVVRTTTNQTVGGIKTFSSPIIVVSGGGDSAFGAGADGSSGTYIALSSGGDANNAYMGAKGSGTNVGLVIQAKGTGSISFQSAGGTVLSMLTSGQLKTVSGNETTGAGSAALGTNSPAVTNTAPYKWLKFTTSDGSQVYVPAWK